MIMVHIYESPKIKGKKLYVRIRSGVRSALAGSCLSLAILLLAAAPKPVFSQDDPLNKVHVPVPPAAATPATGAPVGAEAPAATGPDALNKMTPGARIAMNV